jgi:hypothetical protein
MASFKEKKELESPFAACFLAHSAHHLPFPCVFPRSHQVPTGPATATAAWFSLDPEQRKFSRPVQARFSRELDGSSGWSPVLLRIFFGVCYFFRVIYKIIK